MRIVIAPDKFKGSLTAIEVCRAIERGVQRVDPRIEIDSIPMSDGGEGFVSAMVIALRGTTVTRRVTGPLPEMQVDAPIGIVKYEKNTTAIIEMSSASGLHLLRPDERDPLATTTFGTGQLIDLAINELAATRILIGLGGSATNDAGIGAAQACGLPIVLDGGEPDSMTEPLCGRDVDRIVLIKHGRGDRLGNVEIIAATDVTNPLCGSNGATRVFGPQKGATPETIERLDRALQQLARRTRHDDLAEVPGAGAAGGLGFGLLAFFGATLQPGAETVIDAVDLRSRLRGADLCITGEGKIDSQTLSGKLVRRIAQCCRAEGVKCVAIAGDAERSSLEQLRGAGLSDVRAITQIASGDDAFINAAQHVEQLAMKLVSSLGAPFGAG